MAIATSQLEPRVAARPAPRRPNLLQRIVEHRADYIYIAPALLVMLLVIGYPVYYTIYLSFFRTSVSLAAADQSFIGFDNYKAVLGSSSFRDVTINTIIWTVFSTAISFILGPRAPTRIFGIPYGLGPGLNGGVMSVWRVYSPS